MHRRVLRVCRSAILAQPKRRILSAGADYSRRRVYYKIGPAKSETVQPKPEAHFVPEIIGDENIENAILSLAWRLTGKGYRRLNVKWIELLAQAEK